MSERVYKRYLSYEFKHYNKTSLPSTSFVEKGWGVIGSIAKNRIVNERVGEVVAYHSAEDCDYVGEGFSGETVKVLYFDKGKKLSRHYHEKKEEIFLCAWGKIRLLIWNSPDQILPTEDRELLSGDRVVIHPFVVHQMIGVDDLNILVEVSTEDRPEDSIRVEKGD